MALTQQRLQVTFAAANSVSVASGGGSQESDTITLDPTCINASATIKADSAAGTPTATDILYVYYNGSCGDPDAEPDVADEFAGVPANMRLIGVIDCSDEDPGVKTVYLPASPKTAKIMAVTKSDSTAAITFSMQIEQDLSSS